MLAGQRAAVREHHHEQLVARRQRALERPGLARVVVQPRMQVAVAEVRDGREHEAVPVGDLGRRAQRAHELVARRGEVVRVRVGVHAAERARTTSAARSRRSRSPRRCAPRARCRRPPRRTARRLRSRGRCPPRAPRPRSAGRPRRSIGSTPGARWSSARSIVSSMNSQATSPGASSTRRSAQAPACSSCGKPATTTARRSGLRQQAARSAQVVIASVPSLPHTSARRSLGVGVLEPGDAAVAEHDLEAEHVIGRDAVAEAVQAAGVRADVAADHRGRARGRVGRVAQAVPARLAVERGVREARLHERRALLEVELEDGLHLVERDHEAAARGHRRAGQRRAAAARRRWARRARARCAPRSRRAAVVSG